MEEARRFLEAACQADDPLFVAYVLILVLGLRGGEALGLTWKDVDLDARELTITWQLQRVGGKLHHRETKTPGSAAVMPIPDVCVLALKQRGEQQAADKVAAVEVWAGNDLERSQAPRRQSRSVGLLHFDAAQRSKEPHPVLGCGS
ncbi:tyrosine-type recombinase/integrase [Nonomuraea basaltis]|uniref:tyrosine-type recombinase/integrase n=1 Tax=Nonomuraea basaltis TaxID=2495887 RepID=UPI00110C5436|nr:tyrosine-type recombinase/integrase [Nonomuraea basaltis]TMR93439.1 hypothetical protein EJK15_39280 [Nonomuraea basaltis]